MRLKTLDHRRQIDELKKKLKRSSGKKQETEEEFITLYFRNFSEMFEPYSAEKFSGSSVINPGVIEYLESKVSNTQPNKKVIIEIEYGGEVPDDPFIPEKLIKKKLEESILVSTKQNGKILVGSLALALVGIGILGLIDRVPYFSGSYAFNELFVVISWVFIWHFVEMFFFKRVRVRLSRMRMIRILFAEYRIKTPQ